MVSSEEVEALQAIKRKQMSETFRLGAVLALAGGFLDAYSYCVRGRSLPTRRPETWSCLAYTLCGGSGTPR